MLRDGREINKNKTDKEDEEVEKKITSVDWQYFRDGTTISFFSSSWYQFRLWLADNVKVKKNE